MRSIDRIAALILVVAAITILVLAIMVIAEVRLESELNREIIGTQQAQAGFESLRTRLHELKFAAREVACTGRPEAVRAVERHAVEAQADLAYLRERSRTDASLDGPLFAVAEETKAFVLRARGPQPECRGAPDVLAQAAEARMWAAVERALEAQTRRINERAVQQIRVGESLNAYVTWLLAGSITLLGALFAVFRHMQARNRDAQRRIERLAHYDPVTGLPNRALLSDRLGLTLARAARERDAFAIAMFDLDGFKQVNDSLGHAAGDRLLSLVARRARECVRASDTLGRLGGDEFLAILPATTAEGALQVAEKLRKELARPYDVAGSGTGVSASLGVALYPDHGTDADTLLRAADAALYEAKRDGKNRTQLARGSRLQ